MLEISLIGFWLLSAFPALSWRMRMTLLGGGDLEGDIIQALKRAIFEEGEKERESERAIHFT